MGVAQGANPIPQIVVGNDGATVLRVVPGQISPDDRPGFGPRASIYCAGCSCLLDYWGALPAQTGLVMGGHGPRCPYRDLSPWTIRDRLKAGDSLEYALLFAQGEAEARREIPPPTFADVRRVFSEWVDGRRRLLAALIGPRR